MRGEHNFPAAENFAHINITKWFGGKTVEKFNKYPSQISSIASSLQSFVSSA